MTSWLRFAFAVCAAALVWAVAAPAEASAPRCDSRGAITFGPPPKLEEPTRSLDVAPDTSCAQALLRTNAIERGHPAPSVESTSTLEASLVAPRALAASPGEAAPEPLDEHARSLQEWRATLERPPRD